MKKKALSAIGLMGLGIVLFAAMRLFTTILVGMMNAEAIIAKTYSTNCLHFINAIVYIAFLIAALTGNCPERKNISYLLPAGIEFLSSILLVLFAGIITKLFSAPEYTFLPVTEGIRMLGVGMLVGTVLALPLGYLTRKCDPIILLPVVIVATILAFAAGYISFVKHLGITGAMLSLGFMQPLTIRLAAANLGFSAAIPAMMRTGTRPEAAIQARFQLQSTPPLLHPIPAQAAARAAISRPASTAPTTRPRC